MARILLGVSGGIAAYKAVEVVRLAMGAGHSVRVVQTPASLNFVGRATFEGITGAPVLVEEWEPDPARGTFPGDPAPDHAPISHLEIARLCDVLAVAPASANTLAKLAGGHADNLLTSAALACAAPVVVAPAMNAQMWDHPATRANVATLTARGVRVVEPGVGSLASRGEWGAGRLAEPADILAAIEAALGPAAARPAARPTEGTLAGLRVLVTAGGTREPIDAVRYLGNRSSGRMGWSLAREAARRGASVTVVAANVALPRGAGIEYEEVETADELEAATRRHFRASDVLLMAAAVADFRPVAPQAAKIARDEGAGLVLELAPTGDVLAGLAAERTAGQTLVGFAAEHGEAALERARAKLERKGVDAIVVNDVSQPAIGFDAPDNEVTILTATGSQAVPRGPKEAVATAILDAVVELRSAESGAAPRRIRAV